MTPEAYLQLAGNCVSVAICLYMLNYFMKRDEVRENDIRKIIDNNTNVTQQIGKTVEHNSEIIKELKEAMHDKINLFEDLKQVIERNRSANGAR